RDGSSNFCIAAPCAPEGPRRSHSRRLSTASRVPCAITSTDPSGRLRATPRTPKRSASSRVLWRKYTPCTLPVMRNRRVIGPLMRRRSRGTGARRRNGPRAVDLLCAGESRSGMAFGFHRRIARARVLLCLEMLLGAGDGGLRRIEIGGRVFRGAGNPGGGDGLPRIAHLLHGGAAAARQAEDPDN